MKKEMIERLKAALLTVEREELALFEALPEPAVSPDFAERFAARLNEKPEKRPARPFPLRRLIAPVAAALALAFLFIVPVSADGKTLAGVVKALIFPAEEIKTIYTLDLPDNYVQTNRHESLTQVSTTWESFDGKILLIQYLRNQSPLDTTKKSYETTIIEEQLYYHKFFGPKLGYSILWRTEEYDFSLRFFNEADQKTCFDLLATLHIEREYLPATSEISSMIDPATTEAGPFRFTIAGDHSIITEYLGNEDAPVIPSTYQGLPVTEIGPRSFRNCTFLTTLNIPANISRIQSAAFDGCTALKTLVISEHTDFIAEDAFRGCDSIEHLSCPETAFRLFSNLNLQTLDLICNPSSTFFIPEPHRRVLQSVVLPEGIGAIGRNDFRGCEMLERVTIPKSLKEIDNSTFQSCKNLKEIILPDGLEEIGSFAFENCEKLETVTIPKSVTKIGSGVFTGCISLREINVDPENPAYSSVDGVLFTKDGKELVQYPGGKTGAYRIPAGVEKVSATAFRSCAGLTEITLPAGKGWLDSAASKATTGTEYAFTLFHDCSALRAVWIDGDDPQIRSVNGVLFTKDGTTLLCYPAGREGAYEIPDGVTAIAFGAFEGCRGLTAVTLPGTVTEIRTCAFQKCTSLTSLHIPYSVTLIRGSAFYDCDNLTAFSYDGTLAEWDAIQAKMDGIPAQYILTAADGTKDFRRPRPGQTTTAAGL